MNMFEEASLFLVQRLFAFFGEKFRESDDGVQGGSQLMTDAREKLTLEAVETFSFCFPRLQLLQVSLFKQPNLRFYTLALCHIPDGGGYIDTLIRLNRTEAYLDWNLGAVPPPCAKVKSMSHRPSDTSSRKRLAMPWVRRPMRFRHEAVNAAPQ